MRAFQKHGVQITINTRLQSASRARATSCVATLGSDLRTDGRASACVDQVVVEHGTLPLDDLYFALKERFARTAARSTTTALIAGRPQAIRSNPAGSFQLFRIGDAVASRNIHAAIYDGLRLAKDF